MTKTAANGGTKDLPRSVLIVDDDERLCGMLAQYLRQHGSGALLP